MDNILEWLVPLIFAAVYFFGNFFAKKGEDEVPPQPLRPRQSEEGPDPEERQRRIQEEIRRKIMERRAAANQQGPQPEAPSLPMDPRRRQEPTQTRETRERVKETSTPPPIVMPVPETREVAETEISDTFNWDTSDNVYEKAMQDRLQQIEATQREANRLKNQANASRKAFPAARKARTAVAPSVLRGASVRATLKNPAAARTAFIYGEVIGPPVAMRKPGSGSNVPGLG